jgi:hypothetical protein
MVDINEIKDVLKNKDFTAFIPILVSDDLVKIDLDELKPLFIDPDYNLMKMMMLTLQNYKEQLGDDFFDAQEILIYFLWDLEDMFPEIIDSIDDIIGDPEIKSISYLLDEQLLRWYDHSNFFKKFDQPSIFNQVLRHLYNNYTNPGLDWKIHKDVPYYYKGMGNFITDTCRMEVIKLIKELDIDFPIMIDILAWFEFFSPKQLAEIEQIIISKYPGIEESQDHWERKLMMALKTEEVREAAKREKVNKIIEDCAEALLREYQINPALVLTNFQLFPMDFFSNTPRIHLEELHEWHYLRDGLTHAAVIFNERTKEVRLVEPEKYWTEDVMEEFRKRI